jgi:hypothetical protein
MLSIMQIIALQCAAMSVSVNRIRTYNFSFQTVLFVYPYFYIAEKLPVN